MQSATTGFLQEFYKILEEAANAENITLCNLSDIVEKKEFRGTEFWFR